MRVLALLSVLFFVFNFFPGSCFSQAESDMGVGVNFGVRYIKMPGLFDGVTINAGVQSGLFADVIAFSEISINNVTGESSFDRFFELNLGVKTNSRSDDLAYFKAGLGITSGLPNNDFPGVDLNLGLGHNFYINQNLSFCPEFSFHILPRISKAYYNIGTEIRFYIK